MSRGGVTDRIVSILAALLVVAASADCFLTSGYRDRAVRPINPHRTSRYKSLASMTRQSGSKREVLQSRFHCELP
jgi:hypothetical protein